MTDETFEELDPCVVYDEVEEEEEVKKPQKKMAPQDVPWPKDKLPEGASFITDDYARSAIKHTHFRPAPNTCKDIVLDLSDQWSERHARLLVKWFWDGVKPGFTLFVRPDFPAQPDASSKRSYLEGYKQYTK